MAITLDEGKATSTVPLRRQLAPFLLPLCFTTSYFLGEIDTGAPVDLATPVIGLLWAGQLLAQVLVCLVRGLVPGWRVTFSVTATFGTKPGSPVRPVRRG
ncbi:hypothetical protein [Saccharothrix sp. Mg75]|uniref:hypothetical protein n=1 Tax=Saccharothrix sp. Mg75 TaxID=3445357 RepID=UPI003EEB514B